MSSINPMNAPAPTADSLVDFIGREWVFRRLSKWLEADEPRTFLITGEPGSGKSTLAARLVQISAGEATTEAAPRLGTMCLTYSHFCQARLDSTLDPLRFVEALSLQLANRYQPFALALSQVSNQNITINATPVVGTVESGGQVAGAIIKELHIGNLSARVAFNHLVRKPLERLCTKDFQETIVILVDSLDEAMTYDPDENMVTLLGHVMGDLPAQVRFLLTSRPDPQAVNTIGPSTLDLVKDLPQEVDDVREYIAGRMHILPEPRRHDLIERVATAANGNFLYARYVVDDLSSRPDQVVDLHDLALPKDLEDIYRQFLKRELAEKKNSWNEQYGPVLGAIAISLGAGLTRDQLFGIIQLRQPSQLTQGKMDSILEACSQYLTSSGPEGPFRIYHQSFRDFLLADNEYQVYPAEANLAIARFFLAEYEGNWLTCEEIYALQYLPIHLIEAIQSTASRRKRQELMDSHTKLLTDLSFLEAKTGKLGVDAVLVDLRFTLNVASSGNEPQSRIIGLLRVLARQSYQLRGWNSEQHPVFFVQQMHNWAVDLGLTHLIGGETTRLAQLDQPYLLLLWRVGSYSSALEYTLTGHQSDVRGVAITPDGRRAVSASWDSTLKVWDLQTGLEERTLSGHLAPVVAVAMTSNGNRAISGSRDGTLKIWNLQNGREECTLSGHNGNVDAVTMTPDGHRAISGSNGMLKVWDLQTRQEERTLRVSSSAHGIVQAVAITPDGLRAISLADSLIVWDLQNGREERILGTGEGRFNVAMTPDGCRAVVSLHGGLEVWNLQTGREERTLRGHNGVLCGLAITPDGYTAITGPAFGNNTLRVWDLQNGQERQILSGHSGHVCAIAITPDGSRAVSGSADSTLKVWNLQTGQEKRIVSGHDGSICNIAMASDAGRAVSSSWDGTLKVWDLQTGLVEYTLKNNIGPGYVAITPDGHWAISSELKVWDLQTGKEKTPPGVSHAYALAMTPDGRRAVSATFDGNLQVWNLQTGQAKRSLPDKVRQVVMTADGRRALTKSSTNILKVWNLQTQKEFTLSSSDGPVKAVAMTPDGRRAVSASNNGTLTVWDLQARREEFTLSSHEGPVEAVAMTPDGRRAVSASNNGKLIVWDLQTQRELAMGAIYGQPSDVALAPDGYTILAGDGIGNIYCLHYVEPNMP